MCICIHDFRALVSTAYLQSLCSCSGFWSAPWYDSGNWRWLPYTGCLNWSSSLGASNGGLDLGLPLSDTQGSFGVRCVLLALFRVLLRRIMLCSAPLCHAMFVVFVICFECRVCFFSLCYLPRLNLCCYVLNTVLSYVLLISGIVCSCLVCYLVYNLCLLSSSSARMLYVTTFVFSYFC